MAYSNNLGKRYPFVICINEDGLAACCDKVHFSGMYYEEELLELRKAIDKSISFYRREKITDSYIKEVDKEELEKEISSWKNAQKREKIKKEDNLYLIRDTILDKLKIGRSVCPKKRLKQLQTANGNKFELLFDVKGKGDLEFSVQDLFSDINTSGEWFENDGSIIKYFSDNFS